ncbi:MAG: thiamine-phosphate kinase [Candidatus Micrarchaeota archaeon]|nr:thiamine-phosphate kinase [Candidatus Micrarchaeota archaeon]
MDAKLDGLGERAIIKQIRRQYDYSWPDDDCAFVENGREYLLLSTDSISRSEHIPDAAKYRTIGYFFAAVNLSDIAAMGGKPKYFMSALTLPKGMKLKELRELERGMRKCLDRYDVKLIGGDLKPGRELNLSGTVMGIVPRKSILKRTGAHDGDIVCITGELGRNAAGYYLWKQGGLRKGAEMLLKVEPRIWEGLAISEAGASSAIDLSDGLFAALLQLREITSHGFEIDYSKVPINREAGLVSKRFGISIEDIAFDFGGEYELLFTVPRSRIKGLEAMAKSKGFKISRIGVVKGKECMLIKNGRKNRIKGHGYEHFSV